MGANYQAFQLGGFLCMAVSVGAITDAMGGEEGVAML